MTEATIATAFSMAAALVSNPRGEEMAKLFMEMLEGGSSVERWREIIGIGISVSNHAAGLQHWRPYGLSISAASKIADIKKTA